MTGCDNLKRFLSVFLLLAVILSVAPTANAAGSAYWSGPSVVRAGDTITLTFSAGGGIYGGSGSVSYDSSLLTLQGYSQSIGGSWALEWGGNNFVFYDNSMSSPISGSSAIFKATFTVNASAPTGAAITVSATGVTLSDGQQDMGIGTASYSTTVAKPLSGNCNLASMTVSGASISPAFNPNTTKYSAKVPFSTSSIGVNATAADGAAKVSVHNPGLTAGGTTTVQVTVTAENGATKTYSISVAREQDPNYVKSSNAKLQSLAADGYALSPAFSPEVTQYYVWLPYEAESIELSASAADSKASSSVGGYEALTPGEGTDIAVTVTAEDGTKKVYTVTVVRAPAHDQVEQYLLSRQEPVPTEATEATEPTEVTVETVPPTEPAPQPEEPAQPTYSIGILILTGVIGFALGAGLLLLHSLWKKKYA